MGRMEEAGVGTCGLQHSRTPIPTKCATAQHRTPKPPPSANRLASSLPLISGWSCCYLFQFPISSDPHGWNDGSFPFSSSAMTAIHNQHDGHFPTSPGVDQGCMRGGNRVGTTACSISSGAIPMSNSMRPFCHTVLYHTSVLPAGRHRSTESQVMASSCRMPGKVTEIEQSNGSLPWISSEGSCRQLLWLP